MRRVSLSLALAALLGACASAPAPKPEATPAVPANPEAWRATPPRPGQPPALVTPKFEKAVLPNGLTVIVSERHDLPVVSLDVAFAAGSADDPRGKAGLAELTYDLLLEGAGKLDALALDAAFADLGTEPDVSTVSDGALVGTQVLTRNLDAATALLADVVRRPTFEAKAFDRRKKQQLANLALQVGNPRFLASEAFAATVYGEDHPYGHPGSGLPATVKGLTLADAKRFYADHAGPGAAAIVFAGDVTMDRARALAEKYFGDWKGTAKPSPRPATPAPASRQGVVFVPKAGLNQTVMVFGRPAIAAGAPDEFDLDLATTVFGGFFGSRLNMNLREAHGYTYGARAYVDPRRGVGPLVASSSVRADATGASLQETVNELRGLKTHPITKEELEAAREGQIRSLPGSFETVGGVGMAAADLFWKDLPLDRYQRMIEGYQKATQESVQAAALKYLDPAALQIVLVGDPDAVQLQVPALNLGELKLREPLSTPAPAKQAPAKQAPAKKAARKK
jgi:predicted Zn-dependent peptidase